MNKLNKESKVYVIQYNETLVIHYDNNMGYYFGSSRKDVRLFTDSSRDGGLHTILTGMTHYLPSIKKIETIIIDPLLVNYKLRSCKDLFFNFTSLKRIVGLEYLNTSEVTNMEGMFHNCRNLTSLNLRGLDTSNVDDMSSMFRHCKNLTNLDLNSLNTSNVRDMDNMFAYCEGLTSLDLSNFNTSKVAGTCYMFCGCKNLKKIYVRTNWDTSNVRDSEEMFLDCPKLVGGKGTRTRNDHDIVDYDQELVNKTFAKIDGGKDNPGYFSYNYNKL
jgi:surface protein